MADKKLDFSQNIKETHTFKDGDYIFYPAEFVKTISVNVAEYLKLQKLNSNIQPIEKFLKDKYALRIKAELNVQRSVTISPFDGVFEYTEDGRRITSLEPNLIGCLVEDLDTGESKHLYPSWRSLRNKIALDIANTFTMSLDDSTGILEYNFAYSVDMERKIERFLYYIFGFKFFDDKKFISFPNGFSSILASARVNYSSDSCGHEFFDTEVFEAVLPTGSKCIVAQNSVLKHVFNAQDAGYVLKYSPLRRRQGIGLRAPFTDDYSTYVQISDVLNGLANQIMISGERNDQIKWIIE